MPDILLTIPTEPHEPQVYLLTNPQQEVYFYPIISKSRKLLLDALFNDDIELPVPESPLLNHPEQVNQKSGEASLIFMEQLFIGNIFDRQSEGAEPAIPPAIPWEIMVVYLRHALKSKYDGTRLAALRFSVTVANILTVGNLKLQRDFISKVPYQGRFLNDLAELIEFPLQLSHPTELEFTAISQAKAILLATQLMYFPADIRINTEHITRYLNYLTKIGHDNQLIAQSYLFIQLTSFSRIERSEIEPETAQRFGELLKSICENNQLLEQLASGYISNDAFTAAKETLLAISSHLIHTGTSSERSPE